jgi:cytochrome c
MKTTLLLLCSAMIAGCNRETERHAAAMTGGDPHTGRSKISYYGCGGCHTIPGITNANALVGPPLSQVGSRMYIAGVLRNTPDNMIKWIKNPPANDPKTAMPNLHINETDARDIASYLYTLQ